MNDTPTAQQLEQLSAMRTARANRYANRNSSPPPAADTAAAALAPAHDHVPVLAPAHGPDNAPADIAPAPAPVPVPVPVPAPVLAPAVFAHLGGKRPMKSMMTRGPEGDPRKGAECVPRAVCHLSGIAFNYADFSQYELEAGLGFTKDETMAALKSFFPGCLVKRLKLTRRSPRLTMEAILKAGKDLTSKKLLVFGTLIDDRDRAAKRERLLSTDWYHCAAINLDDKLQYWCAYHGSQVLVEGMAKFKHIDHVIEFEY
jgi:hypothetical protein